MSARKSRVVVVTRPTPLEQLIQRYGTYGQAKFYLDGRGQDIGWLEANHERVGAGLATAIAAIPENTPWLRIGRDDLDRFLFAPDDRVMMIGQDGLVPNVAKYLDGQLAVGVNPDPGSYEGVLCALAPDQVGAALVWSPGSAGFSVQSRVMAEATLDNGQTLLALNELFIGHVTHQSARYRISIAGRSERHSSSGVIVSTGTGTTGWARSIIKQRRLDARLPGPEEPQVAWFVREPWPSVSTQATLDFGLAGTGAPLTIDSEMSDGGVIFADGIEADRIDFHAGRTVRITESSRRLRLLMPKT